MTNARMYGLIAAVCLLAAGVIADMGFYLTALAMGSISLCYGAATMISFDEGK